MLILADTGVLLRLADPADPHHAMVRQAFQVVHSRGDRLTIASQNAAEFWNVCTRPATARGGWGLSIAESNRRLALLETAFSFLTELPSAYPIWRNLIVTYAVQGKQVHDARLVALMKAHGITHVLTLNSGDFARFSGIIEIAPASLTSSSLTSPSI